MRKKKLIIATMAALLATGVSAVSASAAYQRFAGPKADGTGVTPHDWNLTPAGDQVNLGDFPMGGALSPDGNYLVVSNDGQGTQSLQVVNTKTKNVVQTLSYDSPQSLYLGVAFSPDGKTVYASSGGSNKIHVYDFNNGTLTEKDSISVQQDGSSTNFYPAGLSVSPDGQYLFVANNLDNSLSKIDLNTQKVVKTTPVGQNPYTTYLSKNGKLYVTNWGESSVSVLDPTTMDVAQTINVGLHPNAIVENPVSGDLYISNSDDDTISVLDPKTNQVTQTISLSPYKGAPTGSIPDAVSVSRDGKTLYVANAGNNDVALFDVSGKKAKIKGLIPTAWYPTGVYLTNNDQTLMVPNAKGLGAGPNTNGQYIGNMIQGTLSVINNPSDQELKKDTKQVIKNNTIDNGGKKGEAKGSPIPRTVGQASPIKHVIYIIKENRTYDQVFGDLKKGNGDPSLTSFGAQVTPNLHKLANQFVTLDNFYADAEISAQGHNWTTGAIANDYVEKNWLANYSGRKRSYDFEGTNSATYPKEGFLWDDATRSNVSYRDYGEFMNYDKTTGKWVPADPSITNYDTSYPGWNLTISDLTRFNEWNTEFQNFEKNGNLPQLEIVRLPNDHTSGTKTGALTPQAMVAQNDQAVGKIVDAVSHSKDWKNTAIFITEDDAQNGYDHVDAHRTESLVVSPYTQTGKVDSTFYDTTSMVRTMELILGMKAMTQFDASSIPMLHTFTNHPNFTAYNVQAPQYPLDAINGQNAPDATVSNSLDFSSADKANEAKLNKAIWDDTHPGKPYPKQK